MSSNITNALINKVKNRKVLRKGQIRGHLKSKYSLSIFVSLNLWVKIFIDSFIIKSNNHPSNKKPYECAEEGKIRLLNIYQRLYYYT